MATQISIEEVIEMARKEFDENGRSDAFVKIENKVLQLKNPLLSYRFYKTFFSKNVDVDVEKHLDVLWNSEHRVFYMPFVAQDTNSQEKLKEVYDFVMLAHKFLAFKMHKLDYHVPETATILALRYKDADVNKLFDFVAHNHVRWEMRKFLDCENIDAARVVKQFLNEVDKITSTDDKVQDMRYFLKDYMESDNQLKDVDVQKIFIDKAINLNDPFGGLRCFEGIPFEKVDIGYMIEQSAKNFNQAYWAIPVIINIARRSGKEERIKDINFQPILDVMFERKSLDLLANMATWLCTYQDVKQIEDFVLTNGKLKNVVSYLSQMGGHKLYNYSAIENRILNEATGKDFNLIMDYIVDCSHILGKIHNINYDKISQLILEQNNPRYSSTFAQRSDVDFDKHLAVVSSNKDDYRYKYLKAVHEVRLEKARRKTSCGAKKFVETKDIELIM